MTELEVVATPNFPAYSIATVTGRYVVVGGGGGAARTGIKNKFDVYELYHNGKQTKAERVVSHDVGESCISNLAGWSEQQSPNVDDSLPSLTLALGQDERCVLLKLHPKLDSPLPAEEIVLEDRIDEDDDEVMVRNRVEEMKPSLKQLKEMAQRRRKQERIRRESINSTLRGEQYFTFDIEELEVREAVFSKPADDATADVYQKVVRVSPDHQNLCTGGTDGVLRIWSLPDLKNIAEILAHKHEVDDLDFRPDGKHIVSICKPTKECCIWSFKSKDLVIRLVLHTDKVKYKVYKARYGIVEGKSGEMRLFTISNAIMGTKNPGMIALWNCTKGYVQEKTQTLTGSLSSLSVSNNGRFVAAGTMDGSIYLVIAFSLQVLRKISNVHSTFVTGLEWIPSDSNVSKMVCGFSEASILSISCDNTLKIHHIPRRGMVPLWFVVILTFLVLLGSFTLASYLDL